MSVAPVVIAVVEEGLGADAEQGAGMDGQNLRHRGDVRGVLHNYHSLMMDWTKLTIASVCPP